MNRSNRLEPSARIVQDAQLGACRRALQKLLAISAPFGLLLSMSALDARADVPEVPEYRVTWQVAPLIDEVAQSADLCSTGTCTATGTGLWAGEAVIGTKGNLLSGSETVKYSVSSRWHIESQAVEGSNCSSGWYDRWGTESWNGASSAAQVFFSPVVEVLTSGNRHLSMFYPPSLHTLADGTVSERIDAWSSKYGESHSENSWAIRMGPTRWYHFFAPLGDWDDIPSTDSVGRTFTKQGTVLTTWEQDVGPHEACGKPRYASWEVTVEKPFFVPLEIAAIEVNQAIQDWGNSVDLIERKATYVRAFVTTRREDAAISVPARVQLRGYREGRELERSPLQPINHMAETYAFSEATWGDIAGWRKDFGSSVNFKLPESWTKGRVVLELERRDGSLECRGATYASDKSCATKVVDFAPAPSLEVKFFRVDWTDSAGNTWRLARSDIEKLKKRLIAIYPISELKVMPTERIKFGTILNQSDADFLLVWLELFRVLDACTSENDCRAIYYGALAEGSHSWGGAASGTPSSESYSAMPSNDSSFLRNAHAHEIGHNLGLDHAVSASHDQYGNRYGWCCEVGPPQARVFPYFYVDVENVDPCRSCGVDDSGLPRDGICGSFKAFISESDPQQTTYKSYGLNSSSKRPVPVDPERHFELMSYCGKDNPSGWHWISDFTYTRLLDAIIRRFWSVSASGAGAPAPSPADLLLIPGTIQLSRDVAALLPFMTTSNVMPSAPASGDYSLLALDASLNVVSRVDFKPRVPIHDLPEGSDDEYGSFLIAVPADPRIDQIRIVHNDRILAARTRTSNRPTVSVVFPRPGAVLDHPTEVLSWAASDADNDPLTYAVQYSWDGGASWETLAVDLRDTSYEVETEFIRGTTNGRVRVLASDGFNVGTSTSEGVFSVPNHAPQADISAPRDGDVFAGQQLILLEGSGSDLEDGALAGANLRWRSDKDGSLGGGRNLALAANELSEGNHTITLRVTDSGGLVASQSIEIKVVRTAASGLADLALTIEGPAAVVHAGEQVKYIARVVNHGPDAAIGVTLSDSLPESVRAVTAASSQGTCRVSAGEVKCDLGALSPGAAATVTILGVSAVEGGTSTTASVYGDQADPALLDNEATYEAPSGVPNVPPQANAGADRVVRLGSLVTLDGSASSDPDNGPSPLAFVWTQTSGPIALLVGADTKRPMFTPTVTGSYSFSLTVSDGQSSSSPHSATIFVPLLGDVDLDGDVDSADLDLIVSARGRPASSPNDLRDLDGDATITALDARKLVTLCTRPRCTTQ